MPITTFDDIAPKEKKITTFDEVILKKSRITTFEDITTSPEIKQIKRQRFKGNFTAWLDRALRGQYASANVVKSVQDLSPKEQLTMFTAPYLLKKESAQKVSTAFKAGLTGEQKGSFREVAKKAGMKGKPARVAGFVGDIIYDPTTYFGPGIAKGVKKLVSPIVKPLVKPVAKVIKPIVTPIGKLFKRTTGIPQLDKLVQKYSLKREYLRGKELQYGIKVRNVIQNISKRTGKSIDDISSEIVNLIERPGVIAPSTQATGTLAKTVKAHFASTLAKEMKAGVPITALAERSGIQYFPRITTQEAKQYLKQASKSAGIGRKAWNPKIANAIQRKTGDYTLQEFNELVAQHGLKSLGGRSVEEFFMRQPAYAVAVRGIKSAKATTSAEFLQESGRLFGKTGKAAPEFWEELPKTLQEIYPTLRGKRFDPEVLTELNKVSQRLINPEEINLFMRSYDNVQNLWKAWTLSPFPAYHFRNVIGNLWNNQLADVVNPKVYNKAAQLQRAKKLGILKGNDKQVVDLAERTGVLGRGWYGADIPMAVEESFRKISLNPLKQNNLIIRKGRAIGTTLENNARLAHFIDKLGKGLSPDEAAKSVKKFLFDYGDLSNFEKTIMKRVFPFYTWTRKNLPLQMEQLLKRPEKFIAVEKGRRAISGEQIDRDIGLLKRGVPWLYEKLPFRVGLPSKGVVRYFPLETWLPAADLVKLARPQEIGQELLSPLIKLPLEQLLNLNLYFEQPIQRWGEPFSLTGETREFLKLDVPVRIAHILSSVRLLGEIDRIIKKQAPGRIEVSPVEKIVRPLTGIKVYPYRLSDLQNKVRFRIDQQIRELEKARRWANRNKRFKEVDRINKVIREIRKEKY